MSEKKNFTREITDETEKFFARSSKLFLSSLYAKSQVSTTFGLGSYRETNTQTNK